MREIFRHPTSHNIEWHTVLSLLEAIGDVEVRHDGKVRVTLGSQTEVLEPPRAKDIDEQMVVDLRHLLTQAGFTAP
jgi:hypothetical protein